jgi:hypothetical protein
MSELELSTDARRCLWRCYSLLLKLAEEAEKKTGTDSNTCRDQESVEAKDAAELTRLAQSSGNAKPRQKATLEPVEQ